MTDEKVDRTDQTTGDVTRRQLIGRSASLGAVVALGPVLAACESDDDTASGAAETKAKPGGRLRLGYFDDEATDIINPMAGNSNMALARLVQVFEPLTHYDNNGEIVDWLAEEVSPGATVDEWTVRVPAGVEFQNGKTLTADDIIYTYTFHLDPKNKSVSTAVLGDVDPKGMRKMDERTVRFKLKRPNGFFREIVSLWNLGIFPEGTQNFNNPIGTGPFKLDEITAGGKRTIYSKHPNYRQNGRPYLDRLEIVAINDPQARVNALLAGQVDVISDVPATQVPAVESGGGVSLINTEGGRWNGQVLGTQTPEFEDVRVRQAMKLLVDREQIRDNVFGGHAKIANDMFSWFAPSYPDDVEQRTYDPEQATALLQAAGAENLSVDLNTGDLVQGLLNMSTLMAEDAAEGGVDMTVQNRTADTFFTKYYMQSPLFSTYWGGSGYVITAIRTLVKDSPLNEGAWVDPEYQRVFDEALATSDRGKADELLQETQRIAHERGPYIIPVFPNYLDAHSDDVQGLQESPNFNLGFFNFREANLKS